MDFVSLISNVGFPVVIAMYLLIRIESKLDTLTVSINDLSKSINKLEK